MPPPPTSPRSQVLSSWTQTSASSYNLWAPRQPDRLVRLRVRLVHRLLLRLARQPLRLPFATSCARHDFGYRNYKAANAFDANKSRLDSAFYEDLKRVCAGYSGATATTCDSTAWTYYQAVKVFG